MTVNTGCQFARIQNPLGDKPLGMTEKAFLDEFIEGGNIISGAGVVRRIKRRPGVEVIVTIYLSASRLDAV